MKRTLALILAAIAMTGILATAISTGMDNPDTAWSSALGILKYFTIQSNLIVAIYFSLLYFLKDRKPQAYDRWLGGVTVYITITFLVFVTLLQSTWHPTGLAMFGNILNHYVVPLSVIAFLGYFRQSYRFTVKDMTLWLIYPLVYIVFLLFHGLVTGDYIYPFFQIDVVGLGAFILTFLGIMTLFFILSFAAILLTKKKSNQ